MKILVVLLPLLAVGIQGTEMGDGWKAGAATVGPIELEPTLDGTGFFINMTQVLRTFMDQLQKEFEYQIGQLTLFHLEYAYNATLRIEEAVSNANSSTPSDAFDPLVTEIIAYVRKFIKDFQKPDSVGREDGSRKSVTEIKNQRMSPLQLKHSLNDFRYNAVYIIREDMGILGSYIEQMLFFGHQGILKNMESITSRLETLISLPIKYVQQDLQQALSSWYKMQPYTSHSVLLDFENVIAEALAVH